jgi:hypothetical protein
MRGTVRGSVLSLAAVGVATQSSETTALPRLLLWVAIAAVLAMTVHHPCTSLEGKVRDSTELPARAGL